MADELALEFVFDVPNLSEAIDESNLPAIPQGTYLAAITEAAIKVGENAKDNGMYSLGFNWSFIVNLSSELGSWDAAGRIVPLNGHYTWLGYVPDKESRRVVYGENGKPGFSAVNMLKALNERSGFRPDDYIGRIVRINVVWETSEYQGEVRTRATIKNASLFTNATGEVAPKQPGIERRIPAQDFAPPAIANTGSPF